MSEEKNMISISKKDWLDERVQQFHAGMEAGEEYTLKKIIKVLGIENLINQAVEDHLKKSHNDD